MEEIKLVVVKLILRLLVISKNRFICIKKIVTIRKNKEQIMQSHDIVTFAFLETISTIADEVGNVVEEYNLDANKHSEMLDDANIQSTMVEEKVYLNSL